ncbi:hypothetical protein [Burkholderia pyrrocinia]|uniref:Uncharacterized protein n=1 Tax=Burkholderia pyrrocinia TaxID=60550 RepID=A0ABZ3BNA3_BURPY
MKKLFSSTPNGHHAVAVRYWGGKVAIPTGVLCPRSGFWRAIGNLAPPKFVKKYASMPAIQIRNRYGRQVDHSVYWSFVAARLDVESEPERPWPDHA